MSAKNTRIPRPITGLLSITLLLVFMTSPSVSRAQAQDKNRELLLAAMKGNLAEVTRLLKAGADINAKDQAGWSALTVAIRSRQWDVAKLLLDK